MCPARSGDIRLGGVCSEVETLLPESMTCGIYPVRRISQVYQPAGLTGRRTHRDDRAPPGIQQGSGYAARTQHVSRAVKGIAFANAAQVNLHTGRVELNPIRGKQFDLLITHAGPGLLFVRGGRRRARRGWRLSTN